MTSRSPRAAALACALAFLAAFSPASADPVPDPVGGAATAGMSLTRALEVVLPAMGCDRGREPPPLPAAERRTAWKGRICDAGTGNLPDGLDLLVAGPRGSDADDFERVQLRWKAAPRGPEADKGREDAEDRVRRLLTLFGVADQEPVLAAFFERPLAAGRFPPDISWHSTGQVKVLVEVYGVEKPGDEAEHRITVARPTWTERG